MVMGLNQTAAAFGHALKLNVSTARSHYNVSAFYAWLWPPLRLGQYVCTTSRDGEWIAYATWAYLTEGAERRLVEEDPPFIPLADWNEGDRLWIMDFVSPFLPPLELAKALGTRLAGEHRFYKRLVRTPSGHIRAVRSRSI